MKIATIRSLVRPLVTLGLAAGVVVGFFLGRLSAEQFMSVAMLVIGFWFVSRSAKQGG